MTITLYNNNSEPNVVNKVLTGGVELTGSLRDSADITDPVILIETNHRLNYLYIEDWDRYYFVNSITSVRTGLYAYACHVDLLMTYKENLMNLNAIVGRQQNKYNLMLYDERFMVNQDKIYTCYDFPNPPPPAGTSGRSLVFTIAGGGGLQ